MSENDIHYLQLQHTSSNMLFHILVLSLVGHVLVADHHGDEHDDNCVDNSRYGELKYNVTTKNLCTHNIDRIWGYISWGPYFLIFAKLSSSSVPVKLN